MAAASRRYSTTRSDAEEVRLTVAGGLGEMEVGGPVMNIVPKAGGNPFPGRRSSTSPASTGRGQQPDDELPAPPRYRTSETPGIIKAYDGSASMGGPILQDRVWFYGSYRKLNTITQPRRTSLEQEHRRPVAMGLGRGSQHHGAAAAGPADVHRPLQRPAHEEEPHHLRARIPAALRGVAAEDDDDGCVRQA